MLEMHVKIPNNVLEINFFNLNLTNQRFPEAAQKCLFFFPLGILVIEKVSSLIYTNP